MLSVLNVEFGASFIFVVLLLSLEVYDSTPKFLSHRKFITIRHVSGAFVLKNVIFPISFMFNGTKALLALHELGLQLTI